MQIAEVLSVYSLGDVWGEGSVINTLIKMHDRPTQSCSASVNGVYHLSIVSFKGCINLWSVLSGGKLVVSFRAVRHETQ